MQQFGENKAALSVDDGKMLLWGGAVSMASTWTHDVLHGIDLFCTTRIVLRTVQVSPL